MGNVRDTSSFKPIGLAMAAVVAGVGGVHAPVAETVHQRAHAVDPSNDPSREEDHTLILGPSEAVEPFAQPAAGRQADLFEL
ncbi:MAG: hypothetical protein AB7J28_16165 [Hyphomonadaceae bacterium]